MQSRQHDEISAPAPTGGFLRLSAGWASLRPSDATRAPAPTGGFLVPSAAWALLTLALGSWPALVGCTKTDPIKSPFTDDFERAELGSNYRNTGGPYTIVDGELRVSGAFNKPLWLKKQLPRNAVIEFDVRSDSPEGDIKVEAWGDGESFATTKGAYLATSYVFILGGWGNAVSALARLDEHGKDRKERRDLRVEPGKTYHFKIRRAGALVQWFIDGKQFLSLNDTAALEGANHAYFGFNNWKSKLAFDNLRIAPLGKGSPGT
jgi:hypothetical protein